MNAMALSFSLVCMISVGMISLVSSQLYRKEEAITSDFMSFVSFAPGFLYGVGAAAIVPIHFNGPILSALLVKNILYCLSFYFRYESLRKFGPFVGALMLGTQPIAIFFFAWALLGEQISLFQMGSIALVAIALVSLAGTNKNAVASRISLVEFGVYYLLPMLASTLAIIWDRHFLNGQIPSSEFFVLDRIVIIPAFIITLVIFNRSRKISAIWRKQYSKVLTCNWKPLVTVGMLFTISVFAYNSALEIEKAAVVGLFRNSAYPLAAFAGALLFRRKTSLREWMSLSFVALAVVFGVF